MAIVYYPNRVEKKVVPGIDRVMAQRDPVSVSGSQNLASGNLNVTISTKGDWQLNSIMLIFSTASSRDYYARIKNGRKVVTDQNDYLWFHVNGTLPQKITLNQGFYNGSQLAWQLATQLNANSTYNAAGITFVVTYNATAGIFSIAINPGYQVRYLNVNTQQTLSNRDSIAGHLFGLNQDTAFAVGIISDTLVYALNDEAPIISQTGVTNRTHYHDDIHILTIDQSLELEATNAAGACIVTYTVGYEEIV